MPQKDALSSYMMRVQYVARLNESTAYKEPQLIEGYETTVKISDTDEGYKWIGENYN
jgi:hypothetical protein